MNGLSLASEVKSISDTLKEALQPKTIDIFGWEVGAGVVSAFLVTITVTILCLVIRFVSLKEYKAVPTGVQLILEKAVTFFENIAKGAGHSASKYVAPLIFGTAVFIFFGTFIEMFAPKPVFADLNAGIAVGIVGFVTIQGLGLKEKGLGGRIKAQFGGGNKILGPIVGFFKTLSDIILPFSMALRLYGSILSGMLIMEIIYFALEWLWAAWFIPLVGVVPGILSVAFTIFHAVIQAYVFALLVAMFTGEAVE
ncbi:MAG: F0F1 ATP synthase subunit A [Clostridiales bacterium]|jgi:F-type H+-transporting ATPase subunit a|nr:F0F1 ATP synthase subunit A [Clostridiales bacterium]